MTVYYSTGLRQFVGNYGSYKKALQGGVMKIFGGTVPATADAAQSATVLSTISLASGAHTNEVCAAGSITIAGSSGTVTGITVDGKQILGETITYASSLTATAAAIAAAINSYVPPDGRKLIATSSSAVITLTELPGTGTSPNGDVVVTTCSGGDLSATDVNIGTAVAGVASVNGLVYGAMTSGVLAKGSGAWSGVNSASGTATHFRILGSVADAGASSTTLCRIQGTCGISGADYNMSTTTLTAAATHTVDNFTLTVPST